MFLLIVLRCFWMFVFTGIRLWLVVVLVCRDQQGCFGGCLGWIMFFLLWLGGIFGGQYWPSPFFAVSSLQSASDIFKLLDLTGTVLTFVKILHTCLLMKRVLYLVFTGQRPKYA